MDFKRMRLRNLVNKDFNFYPNKKNNIEDESEVINRYDSDDEDEDEKKHSSDIEEEEEGFDLKDSEAYKQVNVENQIIFEEEANESAFQTKKKISGANGVNKSHTHTSFRVVLRLNPRHKIRVVLSHNSQII